MTRGFFLVLALTLVFAPSASAEPLFAVSTDHHGGFTPHLDVWVGDTFDVVVLLDSDGLATQAAEFVLTDLTAIAPGVFQISVTGPPPTFDLDLEDPRGEFIFNFGTCVDPGEEIELVRIRYGIFGLDLPPVDKLMSIRGFGPGDSQPSSFDGDPGVVDCDGNLVAGAMGGQLPPCSWNLGGVQAPGTLVINGQCGTPAATGTMGMIKSRY